jgi:tRNA-dihydrouridine synthase A
MRDAVSIDVTVKHRIGIDDEQSYGFVRDFVGKVAEAGCTTFIVHARNAILKGLSPKENREIPPLKYEYAYQLKRDFLTSKSSSTAASRPKPRSMSTCSTWTA